MTILMEHYDLLAILAARAKADVDRLSRELAEATAAAEKAEEDKAAALRMLNAVRNAYAGWDGHRATATSVLDEIWNIVAPSSVADIDRAILQEKETIAQLRERVEEAVVNRRTRALVGMILEAHANGRNAEMRARGLLPEMLSVEEIADSERRE